MRRSLWVVTEKIHGCNFSFITDGESVRCAKREAFLNDDEDFFGFQEVRDRLSDSIRRSYHRVCLSQGASDERKMTMTVYGELFGGHYPSAPVAAVPVRQAVQTGVFYSSRLEFMAYDIAVSSSARETRFVDFDVAMAALAAEGIMTAQPLLITDFAGCCDFNFSFSTTIPKLLKLPIIEGNDAEGIVAKPIVAAFVPTARGGTDRVIFKRKIEKFQEVMAANDIRIRQSCYEDAALQQTSTRIIRAMLNHNTLTSAVSKVGRPCRSNHDALVEAILKDIVDAVTDTLLPDPTDSATSRSKADATDIVKSFVDRCKVDWKAKVEAFLRDAIE